MRVVIGADTAGAEAGLKRFGGAIGILQNQLARLNQLSLLPNLTFAQQQRISKLINKVSADINSMQGALKRATPAASSASFALQNLGRVAQDSSFGFIGIANNLNPLLESFQRLRLEAGSNVGALKLLGASLLGAGGVGLALSAVTAIMQFSQLGFSAWTGGTKKAKEEADKFKESLRDIEEVQDDAVASVQGQIATINILARVLADANKPYFERNRALNDLKEINKDYFGDLTLESKHLATLKTRVEEYTAALIQEAIVKKFAESIAETAKAISDQERVTEKASGTLNRLNKELEKHDKNTKTDIFGRTTEGHVLSERSKLLKKIREAEKNLAVESEKLTELDVQRIDHTHELNKAKETELGMKDLHTKKAKEEKSAIDQEIESIKNQIAVLEKLKSTAGLLNREQFQLADLKVKLAIAENVKEGGLNQQQLQREIDAIIDKSDLRADIPIRVVAPTGKKAAFDGAAPTTVPLLPINNEVRAGMTAAEQALEDFNTLLQKKLVDIRLNLISGLGEALGTALAGGNVSQIFGGFLSVLADAAIELGKIAIATGVAMEAIKAAFESFGGIGAIAAGVALIALGTFVKAKISKVPKFAEGGIATKPTLGIFGEAGPEALIPLNRGGGMFGGGSFPETIVLVARGKDLHGVLQKTNRSLNRST